MAHTVPAIRLTDTNDHEGEPARPFSPAGDAPRPSFESAAREARGRPQTPTNKSKAKTTSSPGSWGNRASPGRLRTAPTSNGVSSAGDTSREDGNGKQDGAQAQQPAAMDPLSQHILSRTNATSTSPNGRPSTSDNAPNKNGRGAADQSSSSAGLSPVERIDSFESVDAHKDLRKGVKAVAFISKLMGGRKKEDDAPAENESGSNEGRPEGNDAEVFAQPTENIGFSPSQPQPPAYIKMRSKYKKDQEFDRVFLAQELYCRKEGKTQRQNSANKLRRKSSAPPSDANTVWAMEFSRSGRYLAAAGVDGIVRIWQVISSLADRHRHEEQESAQSDASGAGPHAEHLSAPVFIRQPIREYEGHTSTVLDLSWSKNDFLLSSSMDKTVRLWHVSRAECLCTFKHNDFVPSISFHPKDDRFFLAGSLDSKLRLWSIPDKSVAYAAQLQDMITSVAFAAEGKHAIAGCLGGACLFYETEGMKYLSQTQVKSVRSQTAKGAKVTGIQPYQDSRGDAKLLITSNDSRIRLFNLRDRNLEIKFRGNENNHSQIRGSISDDGRYVICGSEDRKAYIWSVGPCEMEKRDKRPVEMFEAHSSITTATCFAPAKTRMLLAESEDPIYDLCNPPPVTLLSRDERGHSRAGSQSSSRHGSRPGSVQATPADVKGEFKKPREPASYVTRSSHKEGNIIVTADFTGSIKVFRQDCAWSKRRGEEWDKSSLFSKRGNGGRLSRNGSVQTRGSQPSLREGRTSLSTSAPASDRILHWRQGIASSSPNINDAARSSPRDTPRDVSPSMKSEDQQSIDSAGAVPAGGPTWSNNLGRSPKSDSMMTSHAAQARASANGTRAPDSPKSRPVEDENPLRISGGTSYLFWDTGKWKANVERQHQINEQGELERLREEQEQGQHHSDDELAAGRNGDVNHLAVRPSMSRGKTEVSELSDERSDDASEYDDAREDYGERSAATATAEANVMECSGCKGRAFKAKRTKMGSTRLVCTRCGQRAS